MKKFKLTINLIIVILITSCSSDDSEIDSSFITDYSWRLEKFIVPTPIDLNLDGISSIDMTEEFECVKNESFHFNIYNEGLAWYQLPGFNYYEVYEEKELIAEIIECEEDYFLLRGGPYRMLNEYTIELKIPYGLNGQHYKLYSFVYEENKLIQTITANYPVSYDESTQLYNDEIIEIQKIFIRD